MGGKKGWLGWAVVETSTKQVKRVDLVIGLFGWWCRKCSRALAWKEKVAGNALNALVGMLG